MLWFRYSSECCVFKVFWFWGIPLIRQKIIPLWLGSCSHHLCVLTLYIDRDSSPSNSYNFLGTQRSRHLLVLLSQRDLCSTCWGKNTQLMINRQQRLCWVLLTRSFHLMGFIINKKYTGAQDRLWALGFDIQQNFNFLRPCNFNLC